MLVSFLIKFSWWSSLSKLLNHLFISLTNCSFLFVCLIEISLAKSIYLECGRCFLTFLLDIWIIIDHHISIQVYFYKMKSFSYNNKKKKSSTQYAYNFNLKYLYEKLFIYLNAEQKIMRFFLLAYIFEFEKALA